MTINKLFLAVAVVLFLIAAFAAGGVITGSLAWALPGGLTALAAAFLV